MGFFLFSLIFSFKLSADCPSEEESFKNNVLKAREYVSVKYYDQASTMLRNHLKCFHDLKVYFELAALYESQQKYYLAGLVFKEAGMIELFSRVDQLRLNESNKSKRLDFKTKIDKKYSELQKKSREMKIAAATIITIGAIATGTGLGIFINDKAFNGNDLIGAQFGLMISGLTLIGIGVGTNFSAIYKYNEAQAYYYIPANNYCVGTTPEEYYEFSELSKQAKKDSAKKIGVHGFTLFTLSIPLFALSIMSFFESYDVIYKDVHKKESSSYSSKLEMGSRMAIAHVAQLFSLIPAIASLTAGAVMVKKSTAWKDINSRESLFTLNVIAPLADPVSKTYGLALGFSF